jgi:nucleotide-binding universal stress UspA family protein
VRPFKKILVPIADFSVHSKHALLTAADISCRYQAAVTVLHVCSAELSSVYPSQPAHAPARSARAPADLAGLFESVRSDLRAAGVLEVDVQQVHGLPDVEIVRVADAGGYDLIVLGTHHHSGLGSVSERIVHTATCAVLSTPVPEQHAEHSCAEPAARDPARLTPEG